jgi:hypothetical protein
MTLHFDVHVQSTELLDQVPDAWRSAQFEWMLEDMDYGETTGLSADDLREMCVLSLQEREPDKAAEIVLRCRFGDKLRDGQVRNCSHEMLDEKLWEDYADISFHEDFFHAGSLLWQAFPRDVPTPDGLRVVVDATANDSLGRKFLHGKLSESFIVRVLSDGMPDGAVLRRLFDDQLAGGPFPEAEAIVWSFKASRTNDTSIRLDVLSSDYWLNSLKGVRSFVSEHSSERTEAIQSVD